MTGIFIKNVFFSWRQVFNEQLMLLCLERCSWENELFHPVFFDYLKKTNTNFNTKDHSRQEDQKRGAFETEEPITSDLVFLMDQSYFAKEVAPQRDQLRTSSVSEVFEEAGCP